MKALEIKLKSWGNGSNSGPWGKFDFKDEDELNLVKNLIGQRFALVPLHEEQEVEDIEEPKPEKTAPKNPLAREAAMILQHGNCWRFLEHRMATGPIVSFEQADKEFKEIIKIQSKTEIDTELAAKVAYEYFKQEYRKYCTDKGLI